ncbi:MAG: hypothetical protein CMO55_01225 [Verrucomicrobiales bacterium]|nr:hypothetical protein [Verrucomicrobiales bacterium]
MNSSTTSRFRKLFEDLPEQIQRVAREKYALWKEDSRHPSLHFKQIGNLWSVRVTRNYRALAIFREDTFVWFWIGTHAEYDELLK